MVSSVGGFDDVLSANEQFASTFDDPGLRGVAACGLAVLTCMDSRIDPLAMLGLSKGDAKILRNAGARVTDDVLRTLVLAAYLLGVNRVLVVAHTDCGMSSKTEEQTHAAIHQQSGIDTRSLHFAMVSDQESVLHADVQRIRSSPYLPAHTPVAGAIYDVNSGRLRVVVPE
jgi:carbonic anhydrase